MNSQMIMMAPSHITSLERGHHQDLHHPEMIQQPRRFACDRCRSQKLRCERDIWRPSLMPCKRCRKARMNCTISSLDRPITKKKPSTDRVLKITRPEKPTVAKRQTQGPRENSPGFDHSEQSPVDAAAGLYNEAMHEGFKFMDGATKFMSGLIHQEECYPISGGFEEYPGSVFSGLITPPLEENQEHQIPLDASFMTPSQQQNWTSVNETKGFESFEYDKQFPCLDDREHLWDQENLKRLLDMNMHLLDCQGLVSQDLVMLGNMDPTDALNSLESVSQNVLRYTQQFIDVLKVFVHGDLTSMATTPIPGLMVPGAFMSQTPPTPVQSRRPSHVQSGLPSTVEPVLIQDDDASISSQVSPVAAQFSSSTAQSPSWNANPFKDVQISLILATINCYTCLVGSYHVILSYLLQEIMATTTPRQNPQSSPIFAGFAAAFAATSHVPQPDRHSQLRIIFHTCVRMLGQVETSLGLPEQYCVASFAFPFSVTVQPHHHDKILSSPVAAMILEALVSQRFGMCVNGLAANNNSVKEVISVINQFFDPVLSVNHAPAL